MAHFIIEIPDGDFGINDADLAVHISNVLTSNLAHRGIPFAACRPVVKFSTVIEYEDEDTGALEEAEAFYAEYGE